MALQGSEFKALNSLRLEHLLSKYRAAPGWLCLVTQHWQIDRSDLLIVLDILRALQEKKVCISNERAICLFAAFVV
jgi:hypothetical protein